MARLTYTSGTAYNRKESIMITTPFDINDLFQKVIDNPALPLTGKDKGLNDSVYGVISKGFDIKYNHAKVCELLESSEFHNEVDNHVEATVLARLKKQPRDIGSGSGGPRGGNNGITNALKIEIGELVIGASCVKVGIEPSDASDYEITKEWVVSTITGKNENKPKRRVKNDKERVEELTVKVVMALHSAGISNHDIANDNDMDLTIEQVDEIVGFNL